MGKKKCTHGPWVRADANGWKCTRCGCIQLGGYPDAVEAMLAGAPYAEKP